MEYLNVYDENKKQLNKKITRGDKLEANEHILVSVLFIRNSEGKYLIQETSKEKGGHYSTTGGHVNYNENSLTAIKREVKEELGIDVSNDNLIYIGDLLFGIPFGDIYFLEKTINIKDIKVQKEEVNSVIYVTEAELLNLIKEEKFTKSHGLMFKKLLEYFKNENN